jgi:hypothetical protein
MFCSIAALELESQKEPLKMSAKGFSEPKPAERGRETVLNLGGYGSDPITGQLRNLKLNMRDGLNVIRNDKLGVNMTIRYDSKALAHNALDVVNHQQLRAMSAALLDDSWR